MNTLVKKRFSIIDTSFNNSISDNNLLSLKVSCNTLEFCELDTSQSMVLCLESWNLYENSHFNSIGDALGKVKEDSFIKGRKYRKVLMLPDHSLYTLVPEKLFNATDARKYLELNHSVSFYEKVCIDNIERFKIRNLYGLSYELENAVNTMFPGIEYRHTSTILINSAMEGHNSHIKSFVHFSNRRIDIVVTKENSLLFCNSFSFNSKQDIVYFILQIYRQLGLDTAIDPIVLTSEIETGSAAWEIIYKYIKNVAFGERPDTFQYCQGIKELPGHKFFILFNSLKCE